MKNLKPFLAITVCTLFSHFFMPGALAQGTVTGGETVVIVDKKTNQLHLAKYNDGRLDIAQSFHTTLGQRQGDKMVEGDLKTPDGIYEFMFRTQAPSLKPMFGPLAIYVGYPNVMDKNGEKTGFDILVHGTDDPKRLEKAFDSKGCVVLDNSHVKLVSDSIELKKTKIIITRDFGALSDFSRLAKAKEFLQTWLDAWSSKNIDHYLELYADEFTIDKMNRLQYGKYKAGLNEKYDGIEVKAENPKFFFHEKYDLVEFTQNYRSTFKNGATAFQMKAKKRLWLQDRNGHYRIVIEEAVK
jgi:murein L,D-transpeptidase YafK